MYFTTTKLHQELAGGTFADVIVDEAHDPQSEFPWKGNIDLGKLDALVQRHGADKIAYVSFEHSVNMAGGQPASMDNMREVYAYCGEKKIPVMFDSTRFVENAWMIQSRDPRYHKTQVRDILREMMMYGDGCTVSGKKDFLINIGGILAFRENETWARQAEERLRLYEGTVADGGLATADLAAIAVGVREMLDDRYIRSRIEQTQYLGKLLLDAGIPIVTPPGSHAIFVDARRFLPHLEQDEFPAQRLAAEIYVESGVRAMERGTVSAGRDKKTGENLHPALELVRLTIPRRAYSKDHMRGVAEGIVRVWNRRESIGGLKLVYEPETLRFFQGCFEALSLTPGREAGEVVRRADRNAACPAVDRLRVARARRERRRARAREVDDRHVRQPGAGGQGPRGVLRDPARDGADLDGSRRRAVALRRAGQLQGPRQAVPPAGVPPGRQRGRHDPERRLHAAGQPAGPRRPVGPARRGARGPAGPGRMRDPPAARRRRFVFRVDARQGLREQAGRRRVRDVRGDDHRRPAHQLGSRLGRERQAGVGRDERRVPLREDLLFVSLGAGRHPSRAMLTVRKSADRGHADHGWLDTFHTFSFGGYRDPEHMGFSVLRVLNQDRVQPGMGFGTHPHSDMEIISYVLDGVLEHRDSMGNGAQVRPGEVQFMSAGSGVTHSEFNASKSDELHFLQMWVRPAEPGTAPRYAEKRVFSGDADGGLRLAVSPDGREDSIRIGQDVSLHVGRLHGDDEARHALGPGRRGWLHVARGNLVVNGTELGAGDEVAIEDETDLHLQARGGAELVLFDLP
jgi:tyrosine phenol-lyase